MLTIEEVIAHLEENFYLIRKPKGGKLIIQRIVEVTCSELKLDVHSVLMSKRRHRVLAEARQIIAYIAMNRFFISDSELAQTIARDRSTINYSAASCDKLMQWDKKFKNKVEKIIKSL